jgi:hypothetical protein
MTFSLSTATAVMPGMLRAAFSMKESAFAMTSRLFGVCVPPVRGALDVLAEIDLLEESEDVLRLLNAFALLIDYDWDCYVRDDVLP